MAKASSREVSSDAISRSLSLGTTIRESTNFSSSRIPPFCVLHTTGAFETKRPGDHTNGQDPQFTCDLSDDRSAAGAGAAAHTGCYEQHVGTTDQLSNFIFGFSGCFLADFRVSTSPQAAGLFFLLPGSGCWLWYASKPDCRYSP